MTVQTFRDLLKAQPFKPFRLVMSSGEQYEVQHPEMALLTHSDMVVGFESRREIPTRFHICSLLDVSSIEPLEANRDL